MSVRVIPPLLVAFVAHQAAGQALDRGDRKHASALVRASMAAVECCPPGDAVNALVASLKKVAGKIEALAPVASHGGLP